MDLLLLLLLIIIIHVLVLSSEVVNGQNPPAPGYYPATVYPSSSFYQSFTNLWGGQHQSVSSDQSSTTIWLDQTSGSGFKSTKPYRSGYFGASIKLQSGYTAGVITSFYLSNNQAHPGQHDEVDIEFLGTILGQPYTLQTNVYIDGSGDRSNVIGREVKFHLWFDPTADFHHYAILWNPNEIIFFVDNVPVRVYPKKSSSTFPQRPLWVYGSIWDASSWATDNGRYKADYRYQPFVAKYKRFITIGCTAFAPSYCRTVTASPQGSLTPQQREAMVWARRYHMVYDYCRDSTRDHSQTPECY